MSISRREALLHLGFGAAALSKGPAPALSRVSPATLADLWNGTAALVPDGRTYGESFGMHFVSLCRAGREVRAYYIESDAKSSRNVALAVSTDDGATFRRVSTVLRPGPEAWDRRMATFPAVERDGDTWYLAYEGAGEAGTRYPGDIGLATSRDGLTWTKSASPILVHQHRGHERQNIGTPSLFKVAETWHLFYHSFGERDGSPDDCQICVATGPELTRLTRYAGNPILRTGTSGYDAGTLGKRSIVRSPGDPYYYMVYEVSTDAPYEKALWSSSLARSRDLLNWEKWGGPVLPQTDGGFGFDGPEWFIARDGTVHVYYRQGGATRRATLQRTPVRTFEAERELHHQLGRRDKDGWSCNEGQDRPGFLCYGPYATLTPGRRTARYRLLVADNSADDRRILTLDVYDAANDRILANSDITRKMFRQPNRYQEFPLSFEATSGQRLEFRTYWHGDSYVRQGHVRVA